MFQIYVEKPLQIVITGATGFVAKNLRKYLSESNVHLISISRKNFKTFKNETKIITKTYSEKSLFSKIVNSDALVHLVGVGKQSTTVSFDSINVNLTQNMVNLTKKAKIKKLVFLSGLGASPNSSTEYFISKLNAENHIRNSPINFTIFRPSYIVGKDDLFTKYLKKCIKNKTVQIPGSGKYQIQPIYVDDVTRLILSSIKEEKFSNKIIDLVGPDIITFEKYVKLFLKHSKTKISYIDLEKSYNLAIRNSKFDYSVDDLNILVGNFIGNHKKLSKLSDEKFQSVVQLLKTGALL